ncbi:MAG: hypothetical protein U0326_27455 [Polyangiales bacterium]
MTPEENERDYSKYNPVFGGDLFVPEDVTLEFAPGAVLKFDPPTTVGADGARIEIRGNIKAGLQKIFDVWTPMRPGTQNITEINAGMPSIEDVEDRRRKGAVLLTWTRIEEVLPEWWGAKGGRQGALEDSTAALQAAFDAAFRDRAMLDALTPPTERRLPPIQIRLSSGQYVVGRPLMLEGAVHLPGSDGFKLVGTQSVGSSGSGRPVLLAQFGAGALRFALENEVPLALLFVKSAYGFVVENVCFELTTSSDGTSSQLYHCRTGVWAEAGIRNAAGHRVTGAAGVTGAMQMGRFMNCTFRRNAGNFAFRELFYAGGGIGVGVDPDTGAVAYTDGARDKRDFDRKRNVASSDDLLGLHFDNCMFNLPAVTAPNPVESAASHTIPTDRFAQGAALVIDASNAVPVFINNCNFFGHSQFMIRMIGGNMTTVGSGFHNSHKGGWDIYIDRPGLRGAFPPSSVTVLSSESQSCRFLGTFRAADFAQDARASLATAVINTNLVGVHHSNVQIGYFEDPRNVIEGRSPQFDVPSIDWDAPGLGSSLHLVGCYLNSHVDIGPTATAVMDVGTTFITARGGGPEAGTTNTWPIAAGGRFRGNLKALRGVAGLPSWVENEGDLVTQGAKQLTDPCLRMGENLLMMAAAPENATYPWKVGDVWMRPPMPPPSAATISAPATLGGSLHKARVDRSKVLPEAFGRAFSTYQFESPIGEAVEHKAWEDVFGSENYSGPWVASWDRGRRELVLDGDIALVPGSIYEVLWSVNPYFTTVYTGASTTRAVRSVGRDTITVSGVYGSFAPAGPLLCAIAVTPNNVGGRAVGDSISGPVAVGLAAYFVRPDGFSPSTAVPAERFEGPIEDTPRLRLVFSDVHEKPWGFGQGSQYRVVVRRLM